MTSTERTRFVVRNNGATTPRFVFLNDYKVIGFSEQTRTRKTKTTENDANISQRISRNVTRTTEIEDIM